MDASSPTALVQKLWNYCNILRDDGLSYGDYVEQLTFPLFLKMADEQTKPPFNKPSLKLSGQLLALGQRLQQEPGRTPGASLTGLSVQAAALHALPDNVEIGDTGRTPKQELAFLRAESVSPPADWNASIWHFQHCDEAGAELYFQIAEQRGAREALKWAETYNGPAPKQEPTVK